jgi:putative transposase
MGKQQRDTTPAPTIWEIPDDVWPLIQRMLDAHYPAKPKGHRRVVLRRVCNGSSFRLRTGWQWNRLPEASVDDAGGSLPRAARRGLAVASGRYRHGQSSHGGRPDGSPPARPWEKRVERSLALEATGGPLGATIAGANVHDAKLLAATLEAMVVERPQPTAEQPQHLWLDKGDDHPPGHETAAASQDTPHIRRIGKERLEAKGEKSYPARQWVVERTLAWLSKCRGLLVRYEKRARHDLGLLQFACALMWVRRRAWLTID